MRWQKESAVRNAKLGCIAERARQWSTQEKIPWGSRLWPGSERDRGQSPPDAGVFSKFCKKISYENCKKCIILAYFSKNFTNNELTKNTNSWEILWNFRKFSNFFRKFRKMHYFSIFSKNLTKHALIFRSFGRKIQIIGKFWENYENFWWKFNKKHNV